MAISKNDMAILFKSYITSQSLISHNLDSFNVLIESGLKDIICSVFKIEDTILFDNKNHFYKKNILNKIHYEIKFENVIFKNPRYINHLTNETELLNPYLARRKDKTYSSEISLDITVVINYFGENDFKLSVPYSVKNIPIGNYPIMVKSKLCNIVNSTRDELINIYREDPNDMGGVFIINGVEWAIDTSESVLFNSPRIFNNQYNNELTRLEFISKPGDSFENSKEIIIILFNNNLITVRFVGSSDQYEELDIPFFIIFRILGIINDEIIFKYILYDLEDDNVSSHLIKEYLYKTMDFDDKKNKCYNLIHIYDRIEIIMELARLLFKNTKISLDKVNQKQIIHTILNLIDISLLPHLGVDSSEKTRKKKLLFMGLLIRKLILTKEGHIKETDRDSLNSKRLHTAGISYSKSFKTIFRTTVYNSIKKQFKDYLTTTVDKSEINIHNIFNKVSGYEKLEKAIQKSITTGNKEIYYDKSSKPVKNNLSSQILTRKNHVNTLSTLRVIHAPNTSQSNAAPRAMIMRSVHPSYVGFIDVLSSVTTGEKVGLTKQLAITAQISIASSSLVLYDKIKNIMLVMDNILDKDEFGALLTYTKIYINGNLVGLTEEAHTFLFKIRTMRLKKEIDKMTTIHYDILQDEIFIWVDFGRIIRPLIKVYNNLNDISKKDFKFEQTIKLTKKHLQKLKNNEISIVDLENEGIIEYISAEEQENCYLAYNINEFNNNINNIEKQFTHVDIEESIFGLTALTSPFMNHTNGTRGTYQTNQASQSCGWFALHPEYKYEKKKFFQLYCEMPLVKTVANDIIYPSGQNLLVAMMCYSGFNQEDSTIINKATIDNGYFHGYQYTMEKTFITDFNTEFIKLIKDSDNIQKSHADYSLLDERGIIRVGSIVQRNTVLISKVVLVNRKEEKYIDKSIFYKHDEPMEVDDVDITYYNPQASIIESVKIRLKAYRTLLKGDKLSTRSGNKNILSRIMDPSEMPFTKDGIIPDMIVNPHSIPTRIVIGQLLEAILGKLYINKCEIVDGTSFTNIDLNKVKTELESFGINGFGMEKMYCGHSGCQITSLIFFCPTYIQRLQKFAIDEVYAVAKGPVDDITFQPREGRGSGGGLRLGNAILPKIVSRGIARYLIEIMNKHDAVCWLVYYIFILAYLC
jgi:DNA-directed RNA polymerase beta subunit